MIANLSKTELVSTLDEVCMAFRKDRGKFYTRLQLRILYDYVKVLESDVWYKICKQVIREKTFCPSISEFIDLSRPHVSAYKKSQDSKVYIESSYTPCSLCFNSGQVSAILKTGRRGQPYAFVCGCSAGLARGYSMGIPRWDDLDEVSKDKFLTLNQEALM